MKLGAATNRQQVDEFVCNREVFERQHVSTEPLDRESDVCNDDARYRGHVQAWADAMQLITPRDSAEYCDAHATGGWLAGLNEL